jgi:hypothetical protein
MIDRWLGRQKPEFGKEKTSMKGKKRPSSSSSQSPEKKARGERLEEFN